MTIEDNKIPTITKAVEAAIVKALTAAAVLVHSASVLRCPVDTGNLRSSLAFEVREADEEARIGTNVDYAVKCMPSPVVMQG